MSAKKSNYFEITIWALVLLLLIMVVAPFALGFKIESDYSDLNKRMSDIFKVEIAISSYDRGYFSSQAVLDVQLPGFPEKIKFKEKIIHGPIYLGLINQSKSPFVAAVVRGQIETSVVEDELLKSVFQGQSALLYQNLIDFAGNVDIHAYMPAINTDVISDGKLHHIESSALNIGLKYNQSEQKIVGENKLNNLIVTSKNEKISLNNLELGFSGKMTENDLLMGDSVLSFDELEIKSSEEQFVLRDFSISSVNSEAASLVNSQLRINARSLFFSNEKLGPIVLQLNANGLNAKSLLEMADANKNLQLKFQSAIPEEQMNAILAEKMMSLIPELLSQAVISIDPLSVQSELGALQANMSFSVNAPNSNVAADLFYLLTAIDFSLSIAVDEDFLKQLVEWQLMAVDEQLSSSLNTQARKSELDISIKQKVAENIKGLLDENWLSFEAGQYKSKIKLQQGILNVNGMQLDPMTQILSQMNAVPMATQ